MTSSSKSSDCAACICACFGCLTMVAALGAGLAWVVFSIIALVKDHSVDFDTLCDCSSKLWEFLLVSVIWSSVYANHIKSARSSTSNSNDSITFIEQLASYAFTITVSVGLMIWGATEVFPENKRTTLSHLATYKMSFILLIVDFVVVGIAACFLLVYLAVVVYDSCCYNCGKKNTPLPQPTTASMDHSSASSDNSNDDYAQTYNPPTSTSAPISIKQHTDSIV